MKRRACRWIIKPWNNKSPQNSAINSSAKHGLLHIILDISWNSSDIQYWMQLRRDLDAIYPLLFDWICSEHEWLQIEIHVTNFKLFLIHPSQSWSSNEIDEFVSHKLNFSHTTNARPFFVGHCNFTDRQFCNFSQFSLAQSSNEKVSILQLFELIPKLPILSFRIVSAVEGTRREKLKKFRVKIEKEMPILKSMSMANDTRFLFRGCRAKQLICNKRQLSIALLRSRWSGTGWAGGELKWAKLRNADLSFYCKNRAWSSGLFTIFWLCNRHESTWSRNWIEKLCIGHQNVSFLANKRTNSR